MREFLSNLTLVTNVGTLDLQIRGFADRQLVRVILAIFSN